MLVTLQFNLTEICIKSVTISDFKKTGYKIQFYKIDIQHQFCHK